MLQKASELDFPSKAGSSLLGKRASALDSLSEAEYSLVRGKKTSDVSSWVCFASEEGFSNGVSVGSRVLFGAGEEDVSSWVFFAVEEGFSNGVSVGSWICFAVEEGFSSGLSVCSWVFFGAGEVDV